MKRGYCLFVALLVTALAASFSGFAQTKVYEFDYNASGNRIKRQLIQLKNTSMAAVPESNQEQDVFEGTLDSREIKIYPNPTRGMLTVEIPVGGFESQVSLRVYNMQGALVTNLKVTDGITTVDLSNRPPGMYIMKISSGQSVSEWKIIKE